LYFLWERQRDRGFDGKVDRAKLGVSIQRSAAIKKSSETMNQAIQTFNPCEEEQTKMALLSDLNSARENLDNSTGADRTHLQSIYAEALKAFSDHVCGNVKGAPAVLLFNERRIRGKAK
jgi:hypothetical protein